MRPPGRRCCASLLLAAALALVPACVGPPPEPVAAAIIEADPALQAASESTLFLLRVKERHRRGGNALASAGVHLGGGLVLTAAHSAPPSLLTGEEDAARVFIRDRVRDVSLAASGIDLAGHPDPEEADIDRDLDWAVLELDAASPGWDGIDAWGTALNGERVFIVGFPLLYMPEGWMRGFVWSNRDGLDWAPPRPVVLEGRVTQAKPTGFRVRVDGGLGEDHGGTSGGGVFAVRGGRPVLVGVANKARFGGDTFGAAAVPKYVRELLEGPAP